MGKNNEILCGFHAVGSALKRQAEGVNNLWIDRNRRDQRVREIIDTAEKVNISVERVDSKVLDKLSHGVRHQGVIAEVRMARQMGEDKLFELLQTIEQPFLLILDRVQDPHNLGACLRTAECAGIDAVILPKDGAASVNETVRRVAAGAAERVSVIYVTNLSRCLAKLKESGVWITGTANESSVSVFKADLTGNVAIILGAEEVGLRKLTRKHCDQVVSIPMAGSVSSLNVSVATGIMLFEAVRQRTIRK